MSICKVFDLTKLNKLLITRLLRLLELEMSQKSWSLIF